MSAIYVQAYVKIQQLQFNNWPLDVQWKLNKPWETGEGEGQNHMGEPKQFCVQKTKPIERQKMKGAEGKRKVKIVSQRKCGLCFYPSPDDIEVSTMNFKTSQEINTHN